MSNMDTYEALATPPNDAVKTIGAGKLKGFSDINPQWRYEALTNRFGPCGIGWKYTVDHWFTQEVSTGETMIFVSVSLYIKDKDAWSDPIPAFGGDFLVKKDKNGLHGNDEGMKMAITDALGTACKMIGVAADIYRGLIAKGASDSKYARREIYQQANTAQDDMRAKAIRKLGEEMKRLQVEKAEASALCGVKYQKLTVSELTTNEVCDLANNLEKYLKEQLAPIDYNDDPESWNNEGVNG
jgi:hypothetical protein